jgi:hypothetical protein
MAENKYDHLFTSGVDPEIQKHRPYATIGFLDGKTFKGCNVIQVFWVGAKPYGPYGTQTWGEIYHGPHEHKNPSLYMYLGTDPDNPLDLGGEIEICVGPEMEKHILTRSTIVFIPANFPHFPWRILKVTRPFIIIDAIQSITNNEKARRDMIPEKDRNGMIFVDTGYQDEGIKPVFDWPENAGPPADYIQPKNST